ncbi:MAG: hypothetical protein JRI22_15040 [Deltaproteobacteria bacterium]|nr:hypothetical protein [Deltaproteobacteria bacterium]
MKIFRPFPVSFILLMLALFTMTGPARAQALDVSLTIAEDAGYARMDEPMTSGVPLPRSAGITSTSSLRLVDESGDTVPAAFMVLGRWGGAPRDTSRPIRWVLIDTNVSVPAYGSVTFRLRNDGAGSAVSSLSVAEDTPEHVVVDTGAARFRVGKTAFRIFDSVTVGGVEIFSPSGSGGIVAARSGEIYSSQNDTPISVTVEQQTTRRLLLKVMGSLRNAAGTALLEYTARLEFFAGKAVVRAYVTIENNNPPEVGEWGDLILDTDYQPIVCQIGSPNSVSLSGISLNLPLASASTFLTESGNSGNLEEPVLLYQDSSGTDYWNNYGPESAPRLQSACTFRGWRLTQGSETLSSGDQSLGWMEVSGGQGGLLTAVRDFWQNFPKALRADSSGMVRVGLFPDEFSADFNLRPGERKTHEVLLAFHAGSLDAAEAEAAAGAFNAPLFMAATPTWYADSKVFGDVGFRDPSRWPIYETYADSVLYPAPDPDPYTGRSTTLLERIEEFNFYGWQDFGDAPVDYEPTEEFRRAGHFNLKYQFSYGMWLQFIRSGDLAWVRLAERANKHLADIDIFHIPRSGRSHWMQGGYFGHSYHDEPGNLNPNRNYGITTFDLCYGVPGMMALYYLRGYPQMLEASLEVVDYQMNIWQLFPEEGEQRKRGAQSYLWHLAEAYRATGDSRYLTELNDFVALGHPSNYGWVADPRGYTPLDPEDSYFRTWMLSLYLFGVGKYLDLLEEFGQPDTLNWRQGLKDYADFLLRWVKQEYEGGRKAVFPYDYYFDGVIADADGNPFVGDCMDYDPGNPVCRETYPAYTWCLVAADVFAYTYKYTGEERYLNEARKFFLAGTEDHYYLDSVPTYYYSKEAANIINNGPFYQFHAGGGVSQQTPSLALLFIPTEARRGESVSLYISLVSPFEWVYLDFYLVMQSPNEEYFSYTADGWMPGIIPAFSAVPIGGASVLRNTPVISGTLPWADPPVDAEGEYQFFAAFTGPGTTTLVGNFASASLVISGE